MTTPAKIHLGFEVGTGRPIEIPLKHMAVTGQTQESGKTTTLEALVSRCGVRSLAFITKRGETNFAGGHRILPYFRDRADWQFVDQLLEAQLHEKNKFLRSWIIRLCRDTKTLADVQRKVREGLIKAKGITEGVYTQLDAYLDLIVPEIGKAMLATSIYLPGLDPSVMDLAGYATPMQMLFVQSAIDWVNEREKGVVVVIPEAWEFIPEQKGSPVKASAIALARKGGGNGNLIWVDSQDMAGVDKTILRACTVWLIGVQREANEIKRNLANIPYGINRPKPQDVALLSKGQFFACWGEHIVKVYVQPAWLYGTTEKNSLAIQIAKGEKTAADAADWANRSPVVRTHTAQLAAPPTEETMSPEQEKKLDRLTEMLQDKLQEKRDQRPVVNGASTRPMVPAPDFDEERLYQRFRERLLKDLPLGGGQVLQVIAPAKLRKDFQIAETERVVQSARALQPLAKRVLKLVETTTDPIGHGAIADRLGRAKSGNSGHTLRKAIEELAALGFVEIVAKIGVRTVLRESIAAHLEFYKASPEEINEVHQAVLFELATEEAAAK